MKKLLLTFAACLAFSSPAMAEKDVEDLYFFQVKFENRVLTEFEQKISYDTHPDFSYQNKMKYYKDCRASSDEAIEVTEGAQGLVSYDEKIDFENLHISVDINASRRLGLCQVPVMENFEINIGFPFLTTTQWGMGSLGNKYTVNAGKVRLDKETGKVIYPKF